MHDLKQQRGQRVKRLREATRLSRRAFALKHGIPPGSLQNWEDGRKGGLTEGGTWRMIKAFESEGIYCTYAWLVHGQGSEPPILSSSNSTAHPNDTISHELAYFHKLHKNAINAVITDTAMTPRYMPGDYVAGKCYFSHEIENAINHDCIVQTNTGNLLIRTLTKAVTAEKYLLTCLNIKEKDISLDKTDLLMAAPIIWVRRKFLA